MNEYQKMFLFYVFIYYVIKGGIVAALYITIKVMMNKALQSHEQFKTQYMQRRAEEEERWKAAYKPKDPAPAKSLDLSQLVTNPNSFTAYSSVGRGCLNLGYPHRMLANS
jgi:hypothetical protein